MAQPGGELNLAEETFAAERFGDVRTENLDRDVPSVLAIVREIHGGHAAATELAIEFVPVGKGAGKSVQVGHATNLPSRCENVQARLASGRCWTRCS